MSFNPNFPKSTQTSFQIYYSKDHKLYDFTIFDHNKNIIHHYHYPNLKTINKIIQQYK